MSKIKKENQNDDKSFNCPSSSQMKMISLNRDGRSAFTPYKVFLAIKII